MHYIYGGLTDFYVAIPNKVKLLAYGDIKKIHGYSFINKERGGLAIGENALLIITSSHFDNPRHWINNYFEKISLVYRAPIYRNNKIISFVFIYELNHFSGKK